MTKAENWTDEDYAEAADQSGALLADECRIVTPHRVIRDTHEGKKGAWVALEVFIWDEHMSEILNGVADA